MSKKHIITCELILGDHEIIDSRIYQMVESIVGIFGENYLVSEETIKAKDFNEYVENRLGIQPPPKLDLFEEEIYQDALKIISKAIKLENDPSYTSDSALCKLIRRIAKGISLYEDDVIAREENKQDIEIKCKSCKGMGTWWITDGSGKTVKCSDCDGKGHQ